MSLEEKGARGLWWEKRRALVTALTLRGHQVDFCSRMTKPSADYPVKPLGNWHDLLFIEFGSSNSQFYGEDLSAVQKMVEDYTGKIVFLNDDPDLPYVWKTVRQKDVGKFSVWMNATRPQPFGGQLTSVRSYDFPFSSLCPRLDPSADYDHEGLVYIGRPNGREKVFDEIFLNRVPLKIHGKEKEWQRFKVSVFPAPNQPDRAHFYRRHLGSLVIADAKHKRMGWRTGRAYHALLAGCPAVVEHDHDALSGFNVFRHPCELLYVAERWKSVATRSNDWRRQIAALDKDKLIMEQTFREFGI